MDLFNLWAVGWEQGGEQHALVFDDRDDANSFFGYLLSRRVTPSLWTL